MDLLQPRNCTHFKTRKLMRLLSRYYDEELAKVGLKATQFTLLTHVARYSPIAFGELAGRVGLDASTLSRNLRRLVNAGLVSVAEGGDARQKAVSITDEGKDLQGRAEIHWRIAQQKVTELLGEEEVTGLHERFQRMLDLLLSNQSQS